MVTKNQCLKVHFATIICSGNDWICIFLEFAEAEQLAIKKTRQLLKIYKLLVIHPSSLLHIYQAQINALTISLSNHNPPHPRDGPWGIHDVIK